MSSSIELRWNYSFFLQVRPVARDLAMVAAPASTTSQAPSLSEAPGPLCRSSAAAVLIPELQQVLAVGFQVGVEHLPSHVHIPDDRVEEEALQRCLAVAVDGGINTETHHGNLATA